jgi:hypothetical protein
MGPAGKPYTLPGGKPPKPKKEKPGQNLGFVTVRMAKGKDRAALAGQSPPKGVKQGTPVRQNYFRYAAKKKKIQRPQEPGNEYDKF